jgi:hypothetical protein
VDVSGHIHALPDLPRRKDLNTQWVFWRRGTPDRPPHDIILIRFIRCGDNIKEKERRPLLQPFVLRDRIFLSLYHGPVPTMIMPFTMALSLQRLCPLPWPCPYNDYALSHGPVPTMTMPFTMALSLQ